MFTVSPDLIVRQMSADGWPDPPRTLGELASYAAEQLVRAALNHHMCTTTPTTYKLVEIAPDHYLCAQIVSTIALDIYRLCGGCKQLMHRTPIGWRHVSDRYVPSLSLVH